jgi:CRP-like cAMP-binding protein
MKNPLVLKLHRFSELTEIEIDALVQLCQGSSSAPKGHVIVSEGEKPETVRIILKGMAARIKVTEDGDRKIVGFMVPGDMCDMHAFILEKTDHQIEALNNCAFAEIPRKSLLQFFDDFPRVTRAMWWSTMVDESILRQWLLNLASGTSYERAAHILCEICIRLSTVGLTAQTGCRIGVSQEDISDAVGLTRSHLSRSLQQLQAEGLIQLDRLSITVTDLEGLKRAGRFDVEYLHLEKPL